MTDHDKLRAEDLAHLWHPFTPINRLAREDFPIISQAEGVMMTDIRGRTYLDGISSWWCVNLGHRHPALIQAMRLQADRLDQSILGGMSHENAIQLAGKLADVTPPGLERVIFASDGACATETAIKIAVQYWHNLGQPQRHKIVSLEEGYHGDTLGAVGAGYVDSFHRSFKSVIKPSLRASSPHCFHCRWCKSRETCNAECFADMEGVVRNHSDTIAAVMVEPLCQGAAGMRIYSPAYLKKLRALCDETGCLLIADEVAVGFGRTGAMFACERAAIAPDILCLGKALTGGLLPLSATVCQSRVYEAFKSTADQDRTFYHGHTTCGSPITCAVALAAIGVLEQDDVLNKAAPVMAKLKTGFAELQGMPGVFKTDAMGMMSALEIDAAQGGAKRARRIARRALSLGLFIRPLGNVLYLWPPLTTTEDEMDRMLDIFTEALG